MTLEPRKLNPAHSPTPPQAAKRPQVRTYHDDSFSDNYDWLRHKDDSEVLAHLRAEQSYTEAMTASQEPLREKIFAEIKSRVQETDLSTPFRQDDWWYYSRSIEGKQYSMFCRTPASNTGDLSTDWTPPPLDAAATDGSLAQEQILLDNNAEAEGHPFFSLGARELTHDHRHLAYAIDTTGDERFTLRIKDLTTGELLPDVVENVFYGLAFSPSGEELFYLVVDDSWRPYQVKCHRLGTDATQDRVIFQEDDPGLWLGFELSSDRQQLVISVSCSEYSESWLLDLNSAPGGSSDARPQLVISREHRILYDVEPLDLNGERQLLLTHDYQAPNSMLSLLPVSETKKPFSAQQWHTVLPHQETVRIYGTFLNQSHAVISFRDAGLEKVGILEVAKLADEDPAASLQIPSFPEALVSVEPMGLDYHSPVLRVRHTTFTTPTRVYDYFLGTGDLVLRKETRVLGDYSPENYIAERHWAQADDGTEIPLSVIRHHTVTANAQNPVIIYGYGSYESSTDPGLSIPRLSLLDRGVVFVIAHVRGGGELGRSWYETGKKLQKKNTFTDFIAATDWVVASQWGDPQRIAATGGSAGGLLMGAVVNLAPEKYRAVLAQVPFVDALTTILNPDLPLSALEWEEWGNPLEDAEVYRYMKSYTPYENVPAASYPKIAAVTSLHDTRVLYVEPAKWVQVLREQNTGTEPIVLKVEMDGGHGGASGRYEGWKARAWDYAFLLDALEASAPLSQ